MCMLHKLKSQAMPTYFMKSYEVLLLAFLCLPLHFLHSIHSLVEIKNYERTEICISIIFKPGIMYTLFHLTQPC